MEQNWINISDELPNNGEFILVWQENLSDSNSSRWQKALYSDYGDIKVFDVYPIVFREQYINKDDFIGTDLEGDKIQITHWLKINKKQSDNYKNKFKMEYVFTIPEDRTMCVYIAKKVDFDKGSISSYDLPRGLYTQLESKGIYEMMEGIFEVEDVELTRKTLLNMGMIENK